MVQEWECGECGFIAVGHRPPSRCPECGVPQSVFYLLEEEDEDYFEDYDDMDHWDDDFDDDEV